MGGGASSDVARVCRRDVVDAEPPGTAWGWRSGEDDVKAGSECGMSDFNGHGIGDLVVWWCGGVVVVVVEIQVTCQSRTSCRRGRGRMRVLMNMGEDACAHEYG